MYKSYKNKMCMFYYYYFKNYSSNVLAKEINETVKRGFY